MERFDCVVLGGGSGGLACARRAARHGARVALVEERDLGGTCVHRGCVPKKILWNAAEVAEAQRDAFGYGFGAVDPVFDWARFRVSWKNELERLRGIYAANLDRDGVHFVAGRGVATRDRAVMVGERRLEAEHLVLAPGGAPDVPDLPGAELGITSDGFFELETLPRRVLVVGSGYVAVELGGVLEGLGVEVTLACRGEGVLRKFPRSVAHHLERAMTARGVVFERNFVAARLEGAPGSLALRSETGRVLGDFDVVVWAVGRSPRTSEYSATSAPAGHLVVDLDERGHVRTDSFENTSVPRVYAIGDVTGKLELTPVAIAAGRRLADRLFGGEPEAKLDYTDVPTVVFGHPPIGTVGLSEEAARERFGESVRVYRAEFTDTYHRFSARPAKTLVELVCRGAEERVVGVHVVGRSADEMIQGFAVALRMGATKADFDRTVAVHPTASEELVTLR